jgi:hypothetical protein
MVSFGAAKARQICIAGPLPAALAIAAPARKPMGQIIGK